MTTSPHVDFTDPPTSEAEWRAFVASLAEWDGATPAATVVVAPHPDDESLAVGGTISEWAAAGTHVAVVAVTDGEGSHPGRGGLAERRRREQARALAALGITTDPVRLGLPDTAVAEHEPAVVEALLSVVGEAAETAAVAAADVVLVAPWERDAHSDHDACGRAAVIASQRTGATLLAYPGWAWQWATPADFGGLILRRHPLSADARRHKADAEGAFTSQTTSLDGAAPILSDQFLDRFRRPDEVLILGA